MKFNFYLFFIDHLEHEKGNTGVNNVSTIAQQTFLSEVDKQMWIKIYEMVNSGGLSILIHVELLPNSLLVSLLVSAGSIRNLSVLFMRMQNLVTSLENLCESRNVCKSDYDVRI